MFFRFSNKIKSLIFCVILMLLMVLFFINKPATETNLLKTLLPKNIIENTDLLDMADKSASVVRVVFEAKDENSLYEMKNDFVSNLDLEFFVSYNDEVNELLNFFITNPTNFLSYQTREELKKEKYELVYEKALAELFNPLAVPLTEFYNDPYFLLWDYFKSQNLKYGENKYIDGKYYDYLILNIKNHTGLSPSIVNGKIKELIRLQKKYSHNNKIYLAGSPVHTYYASRNSIISINVICLLATFLIIFLTYFYFRNLKFLLPIALSIITGFFAGYVATITIFQTFHILTLVFATTLIGIGIDYSYHYMFYGELNSKFIKNLSFSLITTVTAFSLLYLSNIELLKEVSVFVSVGLVTIYLTVLLLYPSIKFPNAIYKITLFNDIEKIKPFFFSVLAVVIFAGLIGIKFNDTLSAFYEPSKKLKNAEILFDKISQQNFQQAKILAIKGDNLEDILQKEELITDKLQEKKISFVALSKIFPSEKRQKENISLVKNLYKNNLSAFSDYLTEEQIIPLKNMDRNPVLPDLQKYGLLNKFMLKENTSLVFVNSNEMVSFGESFVEVIDINESCSMYLKEYRNILLKLLPLVFFAVFAILYFIYGVQKAIRMIVPPLVGCLSSVAFLSLLNIPVNMFTLIALFLILGFTIDYSIFRVGAGKNSEDAIFISCITTLFSFGALSFVSFKFISSFALVLFFGILISYITGMFLSNADKEQI